VVKELEALKGAILFIDEIHNRDRRGCDLGRSDGRLQSVEAGACRRERALLGSTTYKEYRQYFEKDRALVRRFQKIDIAEPTVPDAIKILKGLKPYFEGISQGSVTPMKR